MKRLFQVKEGLEINGELALAMIGGGMLASIVFESILPLIVISAAVGVSYCIASKIRLEQRGCSLPLPNPQNPGEFRQ